MHAAACRFSCTRTQMHVPDFIWSGSALQEFKCNSILRATTPINDSPHNGQRLSLELVDRAFSFASETACLRLSCRAFSSTAPSGFAPLQCLHLLFLNMCGLKRPQLHSLLDFLNPAFVSMCTSQEILGQYI